MEDEAGFISFIWRSQRSKLLWQSTAPHSWRRDAISNALQLCTNNCCDARRNRREVGEVEKQGRSRSIGPTSANKRQRKDDGQCDQDQQQEANSQ